MKQKSNNNKLDHFLLLIKVMGKCLGSPSIVLSSVCSISNFFHRQQKTDSSHSSLFCYLQKSLICFIFFFKNILSKNWPMQQLSTLFITYSQFKNVFSTSFSAASMLPVCFKRLRGSSLGISVIFAYLLLRYQDKNNL